MVVTARNEVENAIRKIVGTRGTLNAMRVTYATATLIAYGKLGLFGQEELEGYGRRITELEDPCFH